VVIVLVGVADVVTDVIAGVDVVVLEEAGLHPTDAIKTTMHETEIPKIRKYLLIIKLSPMKFVIYGIS
jgi:hypothetical protein